MRISTLPTDPGFGACDDPRQWHASLDGEELTAEKYSAAGPYVQTADEEHGYVMLLTASPWEIAERRDGVVKVWKDDE